MKTEQYQMNSIVIKKKKNCKQQQFR
jgi:hypothetical protein